MEIGGHHQHHHTASPDTHNQQSNIYKNINDLLEIHSLNTDLLEMNLAQIARIRRKSTIDFIHYRLIINYAFYKMNINRYNKRNILQRVIKTKSSE